MQITPVPANLISHTLIRPVGKTKIKNFKVPANLISHTLIRPVGKTKIKNFHVFDIHWLYRMPFLRLTSLNLMTSLSVMVKSSQYGRCLQSKWLHYQKPTFRNEVCKKKNLSWVWGTDRKICPSGSQSDIISASLVMPDSNLFLSTPHTHDRFL